MLNCNLQKFIPLTSAEMTARKWDILDFLIISGDAYVDHPSFGTALIARWLEYLGYRVGIIAQPDCRQDKDFLQLGRPRLAIMISSGNMDSMLANYSAAKRKRKIDNYAPGGKAGLRPDYAVTVYCRKAKELFPDCPVIIGGIEASLRRFVHYDYWQNSLRRSILWDSKADMLIYGMAETAIAEVAARLAAGEDVAAINGIAGTCRLLTVEQLAKAQNYSQVAGWSELQADRELLARIWCQQEKEQNPYIGKAIVQQQAADSYLWQERPAKPLPQKQMDNLYALPFSRQWHYTYDAKGGVPALQEVKFSITGQRGCFGGCGFCALTFHQGRIIQNRSLQSIVEEAEKITRFSDFKGYIHDIGGPTANFHQIACEKQKKVGACSNRQCLHPQPCSNLQVDHRQYLQVLRAVRSLPKVKKAFIRSGLRYDYLLLDKYYEAIISELCEHHISGQLKIAPEHCSRRVLNIMRKPLIGVFEKFKTVYDNVNKKLGKKQFIVPYLISGHPGCDLQAAVELAEYVRDWGYHPEQVQDFIPTPGSLSTAAFYSGIDPISGKKIYICREQRQKAWQRALMQYRDPKNHELVREALRAAGRDDLLGMSPKCLLKPLRGRVDKTINVARKNVKKSKIRNRHHKKTSK